jgi:hypothetical protein
MTWLLVMCYDNIKKDFIETVRLRGDWYQMWTVSSAKVF